MRFCSSIAAALLVIASALCALAAETPSIAKVEVGFSGIAKAGFLTPVWVTVDAADSADEVTLRVVGVDGDAVPVIYQAMSGDRPAPLMLAAGENHRECLYYKVGPQPTVASVELLVGGEVVDSKSIKFRGPQPLASTRELIVTIGPQLGFDDAVKLQPRSESLAYALTNVDSVDQLPSDAWGYEGVDLLVLSTGESSLFGKLSAEQSEAIVTWVLQGGRLFLSTGEGAETKLGVEPWKSILPFTLAAGTPLRDRVGLETLSGNQSLTLQAVRPVVASMTNIRGRIELDEGGVGAGRPLVVRGPAGLGDVFTVAVDLEHPMLVDWKGRSRLIAGLLQRSREEQQQDRDSARRTVNHLGFTDLVGQLRAALDQFSGVTMVNFTTVAILTLIYLLVIGPGDYFFVTMLGLPRWITWVSFPAAALLFCVMGAYLGTVAHGEQLNINQLEVVDIDANSKTVRSTNWVHLYSPRSMQMKLEVDPSNDVVKFASGDVRGTVDWQGLPGDGLGGLSSRLVQLAEVTPYVVQMPTRGASQLIATDLPLQNAASKSMSIRWTSKMSEIRTSDLRISNNGLLVGKVSTPVDATLTDCMLVYGEWLYLIDKIAPGETLEIGGILPSNRVLAKNLETYLTNKIVVDTKDVSTPWDQQQRDWPRIMQMMMFYEAIRGSNYTGLSHRYQSSIDATPQIRGGRAILVGTLESSVSTLSIDGLPIQPTRKLTLVRVAMDVATVKQATTASSRSQDSDPSKTSTSSAASISAGKTEPSSTEPSSGTSSREEPSS